MKKVLCLVLFIFVSKIALAGQVQLNPATESKTFVNVQSWEISDCDKTTKVKVPVKEKCLFISTAIKNNKKCIVPVNVLKDQGIDPTQFGINLANSLIPIKVDCPQDVDVGQLISYQPHISGGTK
jgi:hypothetical protein